jgi:hypothetical protein
MWGLAQGRVHVALLASLRWSMCPMADQRTRMESSSRAAAARRCQGPRRGIQSAARFGSDLVMVRSHGAPVPPARLSIPSALPRCVAWEYGDLVSTLDHLGGYSIRSSLAEPKA